MQPQMTVEKNDKAPSPGRRFGAASFPSVRLGPGWVRHILFLVILVCLPLSLSSDLAAQTADSAGPSPLGSILDVGGYRVHIFCTGAGSPPVMIVGAAFSFDWDLVQSAVAKFTRVCTFDPSGSVWSDRFDVAVRALEPEGSRRSIPTCGDRAEEIRRVVEHASIQTPYILVGYSVGALWERLYAGRYPAGIGGMVIVDHAFLPRGVEVENNAETRAAQGSYQGPILVARSPLVLGLEDDKDFDKLPPRDQVLHKWAMAQHLIRPDYAMARDCLSRIGLESKKLAYPLGNTPLTVIRTENDAPGYADLQRKLLGLSHQSRQVVAWNSSHMILLDEPDEIVSAIQSMVESIRGGKPERH